ncbi:aldo/keto reductase [Halarcobacter anaerophilus]|uniref:aldo/keto reductase n=1 Tax=Halarcobacter anaerophilus TaxID=877500 RepID=UPI00116393BC|nr:aldo/keto reductase [Halarcobacter anaerophilus]QDF29518.1 aldo/keto reductase [Halarcobacter anaerophilus]
MEFITLNNGLKMPMLGLGTYPLNRLKLLKSIWIAQNNGYISIDTSRSYGNEKWIGRSLKLINLFNNQKLFITTKLGNSDQRKGNVRKALKESMDRLGVNYVDLYLMHWPNPDTYIASWKQMEVLYKEGLVGAIGVCNFHKHHLEKLLKEAEIVPAINQIELHPLLTQEPLRDYCKSKGIQIESYSPVARMDPKLIENPLLVNLSKKYNKTVPQIILRWNIENKIVTIPKSGTKNRIIENIDIFDFKLTSDEVEQINNLNEDYRVRYNPDTVDYYKV